MSTNREILSRMTDDLFDKLKRLNPTFKSNLEKICEIQQRVKLGRSMTQEEQEECNNLRSAMCKIVGKYIQDGVVNYNEDYDHYSIVLGKGNVTENH